MHCTSVTEKAISLTSSQLTTHYPEFLLDYNKTHMGTQYNAHLTVLKPHTELRSSTEKEKNGETTSCQGFSLVAFITSTCKPMKMTFIDIFRISRNCIKKNFSRRNLLRYNRPALNTNVNLCFCFVFLK